MSSLGDPPPPLFMYIKRKDIGHRNLEDPYPGAWNFQGVVFGTIYAPSKTIVMLSCLVWDIRSPPPFSSKLRDPVPHLYIFFYESKRRRIRKHRKPLLRGLKFSGWSARDNLRRLPVKISDVILSSLGDPVPPFLCILSYIKRKENRAPTQGPEIFRAGVRGQYMCPVKI